LSSGRGASIIFENLVPDSIIIQHLDMTSEDDDELEEDQSLDESNSDDESDDVLKRNDSEVCPSKEDYDRFKQKWNDERKKLAVVRKKLEIAKKKRAGAKKIISIKKLPGKMRLPLAKEAMMLLTLKEKIFCSVKIVDAEILKDGIIVKRVMKQAGVRAEDDKKNYRRHFELAITKKIGEFRSNSIRKIRKTFMGERNDLTGKYQMCCSTALLFQLHLTHNSFCISLLVSLFC
jgi:hypothetical protein